MPRVGVTWAPFKSGATTLRSSWGIFHDWLPANTYEQTLRVDGFNQREVDLLNPSFPDVGDIGDRAAGEPLPPRRRPAPAAHQPRERRHRSAAARQVQTSVTYAYQRGVSVFRGLNLNAPVDGVRPDPAFGNIVEVVSDAASRLHEVQFAMTVNPGALIPAFNAPLINWKRATVFTNYTWANLEEQLRRGVRHPGDRQPGAGMGDAPSQEVPHRFNFTFNSQFVRNLLMQMELQHERRHPVHDPHRLRRERRPGLQRSPGRRRPQHRAGADAVEHQSRPPPTPSCSGASRRGCRPASA